MGWKVCFNRWKIWGSAWLLAFAIQPAQGYKLTLHPASDVFHPDPFTMNTRLDLFQPGIFFEDFEDENLLSGLSTDLEPGGMSVNESMIWSGIRCSKPTDAASLQFDIPGIRLLGIGVSANDGGQEQIIINERTPVTLNHLRGYQKNSRGRAYYLQVRAEEEDFDIRSIIFTNGFNLQFDHLALVQVKQESEKLKVPRISVRLTDSSLIHGTPAITQFEVQTDRFHVTLPLDRVLSIENLPDTEELKITLKNGDVIQGEIRPGEWTLKSILGDITIPLDKVRFISAEWHALDPSHDL